MLSLHYLPPPPGTFPTRRLLDLSSPGEVLGNLPQPHHGSGSHWLEPAKRGGGRSLGESEEGGRKDEGWVCVRGGGNYVQKAAKWQLTLLNINHLCFCNFGNASRPTTAEYFINTTRFQRHFSHFSFSHRPLYHPCSPALPLLLLVPAMAMMSIL